MNTKLVLLVLTEKWADWEAAQAIAELNTSSDYRVKTIAVDLLPKKSMGGINAVIDYQIDDFNEFDQLAMVIMPGGMTWKSNDYTKIVNFIKKIQTYNKPIAAICGATQFLGTHGFLDDIKHTGDWKELFENLEGYKGLDNFLEQQVVYDGNIITANETAGVEFAHEIFKVLWANDVEQNQKWLDYYTGKMFKM